MCWKVDAGARGCTECCCCLIQPPTCCSTAAGLLVSTVGSQGHCGHPPTAGDVYHRGRCDKFEAAVFTPIYLFGLFADQRFFNLHLFICFVVIFDLLQPWLLHNDVLWPLQIEKKSTFLPKTCQNFFLIDIRNVLEKSLETPDLEKLKVC